MGERQSGQSWFYFEKTIVFVCGKQETEGQESKNDTGIEGILVGEGVTWIMTMKSGQTKKCFEGRVLVPCQRAEYRQFVRKDLGLIPSVHKVVTNHLSHYSSKGPNAFFWPLWVPGMLRKHDKH